MPKIVDWYMDGKIAIDPMITHVLTLDEINKGFDLMRRGESIRSVVLCQAERSELRHAPLYHPRMSGWAARRLTVGVPVYCGDKQSPIS